MVEKAGISRINNHFSVKSLMWVARRTNLLEPETVKAALASAKTSEGRKRKLVEDLARFYKKTSFDRQRYKKTEKAALHLPRGICPEYALISYVFRPFLATRSIPTMHIAIPSREVEYSPYPPTLPLTVK